MLTKILNKFFNNKPMPKDENFDLIEFCKTQQFDWQQTEADTIDEAREALFI